MKKIILTVSLILSIGLTTQIKAQKVGHINSYELLTSLPEHQSVLKSIQEESVKLRSQLDTMTVEYNSKVVAYQKATDAITEIQNIKTKEITDLKERIEAFQKAAEKSLIEREKELLSPVITKVQEAIKKAAKSEGYDYIIDSSTNALLVSPPQHDILTKVQELLK